MKKNKILNHYKKSLVIVNKIQKIRSKNNKNWMDLYRLAFSVAPEKSIKIVKKIVKKDQKISSLAKKLLK